MRGILECWLKQADKVEKFKHSQISKNALHVRFHLVTGDVVTKDEEYEHLQVITKNRPMMVLVHVYFTSRRLFAILVDFYLLIPSVL